MALSVLETPLHQLAVETINNSVVALATEHFVKGLYSIQLKRSLHSVLATTHLPLKAFAVTSLLQTNGKFVLPILLVVVE